MTRAMTGRTVAAWTLRHCGGSGRIGGGGAARFKGSAFCHPSRSTTRELRVCCGGPAVVDPIHQGSQGTGTRDRVLISVHPAGAARKRRRRWPRLHWCRGATCRRRCVARGRIALSSCRSEEHTSELQSLRHLVCRLLLEKKKTS